ncbi:hypothetical protein NIES970_17620 [[Synechococcus] sp. NIES-970]|nr:hypothetical protein NIES970_17620 [[Synechococcus] sp. NIES-970]
MILKKNTSIVLRVIKKIALRFQKFLFSEILILGDSHVAVFDRPKMRVNFPWYFFNVVSVGGATASGLENPNSITQAFSIFKTNLENSKAKIVIVLLGEVDTGFVI